MTNVKEIANMKRIALVADDHLQKNLIEWASWNCGELMAHQLISTGTTSDLIEQKINQHIDKRDNVTVNINKLKPGSLGGYAQLSTMIVEKKIDLLILLWDPMQLQDQDLQALLRIAVLYNIPTANNFSTAHFLITSTLTMDTCKHSELNVTQNIAC